MGIIHKILHSKTAPGLMLCLAALVALLFANSSLHHLYAGFKNVPIVLQVGKFVIDKPIDLYEILDGFVSKFDIHTSRVWLMPEAITREELIEKRLWLVEQCKLYGFNYSDRLQVLIWNRTTGV